jgi:hypothetical protein
VRHPIDRTPPSTRFPPTKHHCHSPQNPPNQINTLILALVSLFDKPLLLVAESLLP